MSSSELDLQRERAARNQAVFREVNEKIDQLNVRLSDLNAASEYVCECLDLSCTELISIPHDEYARIRRDPTEFVIVPGHEQPHVEEVVHREPRWLVVRKQGVAGAVAAQLADRSQGDERSTS